MPLPATSYLGFHTGKHPFDDPRVRQAFALAIDKTRLANITLRGFEFPAMGGFVPPGLLGHCKEFTIPFDPEKAQKLLKEAGYPSGVGFPSVEFLLPPDYPRDPSLTSQWQENLGIEIEGEKIPWGQFTTRIAEEPTHLFGLAWAADYPDPDNFMSATRMLEQTRWNNETYEDLIEEARRASDQEERIKMYHEAERILADEIPIVPLTYLRWHILVKPWVKNLRLSGTDWLWFKDIILEPH